MGKMAQAVNHKLSYSPQGLQNFYYYYYYCYYYWYCQYCHNYCHYYCNYCDYFYYYYCHYYCHLYKYYYCHYSTDGGGGGRPKCRFEFHEERVDTNVL